MTAIKNMLIGAAWVCLVIGCALGICVLLTHLGVDASSKPPQFEIDFQKACGRLHGTTVWNGKQLECLK